MKFAERPILSRRALGALTVFAAVTTLACGWFTEEDATVEYTEDFSFDLPIDADQLCPEGADCSQNTIPAPEERELDPIELDINIDIVERTGRQELAQYSGSFRSVNVTKIEYTAADNDLSFDVPPITLYLGPTSATSRDDEGVVEMATIPSIPAGTDEEGEADINEANAAELSALIQSLETTAVGYAQPVVKQGQDFPPNGSLDLTVTVYVTFVANPLDAAN